MLRKKRKIIDHLRVSCDMYYNATQSILLAWTRTIVGTKQKQEQNCYTLRSI